MPDLPGASGWWPLGVLLAIYGVPLLLILPKCVSGAADKQSEWWLLPEHTQRYLTFLAVYQKLFSTIALLYLCWAAMVYVLSSFDHSISPRLLFRVTLTEDIRPSFVLLANSTISGVCAIFFIGRYYRDAASEEVPRSGKEHRALWLSNIPVRDQGTLRRHSMTLEDFELVAEEGLRRAVEEHLRKPAGGAARSEHMVRHMTLPRCSCGVFRCKAWCGFAYSCCPCLELRSSQDRGKLEQEVDSSPIEEIIVQPDMSKFSDYVRRYEDIRAAKRRALEAGAEAEQRWRSGSGSAAEPLLGVPPLHGASPSSRWGALSEGGSRWLKRLRAEPDKQRRHFSELSGRCHEEKFNMSGHAFVIFRSSTDRDRMLDRRSWWEFRDHTAFRFGRPPFSSVTLEARVAPHPSDLEWENLHVNSVRVVAILNAMGLVVVLAVATLAIAMLDDVERLCGMPSIGAWLAEHCAGAGQLDHGKGFFLLREAAPLLLMVLNLAVVLPWIQHIGSRRCHFTRSDRKISQLNLGFKTLMSSALAAPLLFLVALEVVGRRRHGSLRADSLAYEAVFQVARAGPFYLKYCFVCALWANVAVLWHIKLRAVSCFRALRALLCRGRCSPATLAASVDLSFLYAWSLNIAGIGLVVGDVVPGMAAAAAAFFLLQRRCEGARLVAAGGPADSGDELRCTYSPGVVHHMFTIVAVKLTLVGVGVLACASGAGSSWDLVGGRCVCLWSYAHILCGLALWAFSSASSWQHLLNRGFPRRGGEPRCPYRAGQELSWDARVHKLQKVEEEQSHSRPEEEDEDDRALRRQLYKLFGGHDVNGRFERFWHLPFDDVSTDS